MMAKAELEVVDTSGLSFHADAEREISSIVCFARNTRIATTRGYIPIENLAIGDKVVTRDSGLKPVLRIGMVTRKAEGASAPIVFRKGVIGNQRDLIVSPNHKMLMMSPMGELWSGEYETLIPAKYMVDGKNVRAVVGGNIEYFHIQLDNHEIILSEGAWTETFHPGRAGWNCLCKTTRNEINELFPDLVPDFTETDVATARKVLDQQESRLVLREMRVDVLGVV